MAAPGDESGARQEAYHYAYISNTFEEGFRATRFYNPWMDKGELFAIYNKAYVRAMRVHYMEDSNQGWFLSKDRLGCPDGGNYLTFNYSVDFTDQDGNARSLWQNITIPMENRIGDNNNSAQGELIDWLTDKYFQGQTFNQVKAHITGIHLTNVRCLVA